MKFIDNAFKTCTNTNILKRLAWNLLIRFISKDQCESIESYKKHIEITIDNEKQLIITNNNDKSIYENISGGGGTKKQIEKAINALNTKIGEVNKAKTTLSDANTAAAAATAGDDPEAKTNTAQAVDNANTALNILIIQLNEEVEKVNTAITDPVGDVGDAIINAETAKKNAETAKTEAEAEIEKAKEYIKKGDGKEDSQKPKQQQPKKQQQKKEGDEVTGEDDDNSKGVQPKSKQKKAPVPTSSQTSGPAPAPVPVPVSGAPTSGQVKGTTTPTPNSNPNPNTSGTSNAFKILGDIDSITSQPQKKPQQLQPQQKKDYQLIINSYFKIVEILICNFYRII